MSTRPPAAGRDKATARRLPGKLARAENLVPAMTLLLASPGFLRRLDDTFCLRGAMPRLGDAWPRGQMTFLQAVASPYRERSHFDARNILGTRGLAASQVRDGWLNKALAARLLHPARSAPAAAARHADRAIRVRLSGAPLTEAARAAGFSSFARFSAAFRIWFGLTPTQPIPTRPLLVSTEVSSAVKNCYRVAYAT